MDQSMNKIILSYLKNTYQIDYESLAHYQVVVKNSKYSKGKISFSEVFNDIQEVFNISVGHAGILYDKWIDESVVSLDNKVADIQYKIYERTGSTLLMDADQEVIKSVVDSLVNMVKLRVVRDVNNVYKFNESEIN